LFLSNVISITIVTCLYRNHPVLRRVYCFIDGNYIIYLIIAIIRYHVLTFSTIVERSRLLICDPVYKASFPTFWTVKRPFFLYLISIHKLPCLFLDMRHSVYLYVMTVNTREWWDEFLLFNFVESPQGKTPKERSSSGYLIEKWKPAFRQNKCVR